MGKATAFDESEKQIAKSNAERIPPKTTKTIRTPNRRRLQPRVRKKLRRKPDQPLENNGKSKRKKSN